MDDTATIRISFPRGLVVATVILAVVLVFTGSLTLQVIGKMYDHDHIFGLLPLFAIDGEGNLPAWLSSTTMLVCAAVAWTNGSLEPGKSELRRGWRITAVALFIMSMDEVAQFHERTGDVVQPMLPEWDLLYFGWVAVGGLVVLVAAPVFVRFVSRLPGRTKYHLYAAAGLFLAGALGVEMATGGYLSEGGGKLTMTYLMLSHVEEFLEMLGFIILLRGLLDHNARFAGPASVDGR